MISMILYILAAEINSLISSPRAAKLLALMDVSYLVLYSGFQIGPMVTATKRMSILLKNGSGDGLMKRLKIAVIDVSTIEFVSKSFLCHISTKLLSLSSYQTSPHMKGVIGAN